MRSTNADSVRLFTRGFLMAASLSIAIFLSVSCASVRTDGVARIFSGTTVSSSDGISVEFSLPPSVRIREGTRAEFTVNLVNESQAPVFYGTINHVRELRIKIIDSNHGMPKPTPEGEREWRPMRSFGWIFHKLNPGESAKWNVDLSSLFLLPPGKYSVSASIEVSTAAGQQGTRFCPGPLEFVVRQ